MRQKPAALLMILGFLAAPPAAHAAKFANQFVEFELPPQWQCNLEGAEWVCQNTNDSKKKDGIIVLAAKLKGDQDTLEKYQEHLEKPKTYTSMQGKPAKSEMKYAKKVNIDGQDWVDSLHMESEIPGFYTRYLATVKQDIGVLVTYSVNQKKWGDYLNDFDVMAKTLKVFRKTGGINENRQGSVLDTKIPVGNVTTDTVFGGGPDITGGGKPDAPAPRPARNGGGVPPIVFLVVIGAVGFVIWKKRQGAG